MANELNSVVPELISVMKDLASMLEKQDTTQEKAKLDKPPKTGEDQKPIIGGTSPNGRPGEGFAKEFVAIPRTSPQAGSTEVDSEGGSLLKENEVAEEDACESAPEEESQEYSEEQDEEETPADISELKSLLKSIAYELSTIKKGQTVSKADIQKYVRSEADHMLRKMGFTPSKPDIVKLSLGLDQTAEVRKSEDSKEVLDIRKADLNSLPGKDLSGLSWRELNQLRQDMGGFNMLNR